MKNILPLLLLVFCVLACGRFGSSPDSNSNKTPNANSNAATPTPSPTPAPAVKIVDIPSLFGKSRDEAKKLVAGTATSEPSLLEWNFPQGALTILYSKNKPSRISFAFKPEAGGDSSMSGLSTAAKVGDMVGIDVKGRTPVSTSPSSETYEQVIEGRTVKVVFDKMGDHFIAIVIDLED